MSVPPIVVIACLKPEAAQRWLEFLEAYCAAEVEAARRREALYIHGARRAGETATEWVERSTRLRAAWHGAIEVAQAAWIAVPYDARRLWVEMGAEQLPAELRARAGVTA
jgi:hypothetical protein